MAYSNFDWRCRRVQLDPEDHLQRLRALNARARIEGPEVFLEVLAERRVWNEMPRSVQDMAIQEVGRRVQEGFTYIKTEVYSCGGQSHRIASFEHKKTGLVLNLIPGGKYLRGSTSAKAYSDEKPVREVTIPAFFVGQTQVTQEAWDKIGGKDRRARHGPRLPIELCPWNVCETWLDKAGDGLRMLSEAEWEYACRAGTRTEYCFGDDSASFGKYAWFGEELSSGKTHPVGEKLPNAFGLYDMHGNVFEWCADWYAENYSDVPDTHKPHLTPASGHVCRGGSWSQAAGSCRSAGRSWCGAGCSEDLSLRVARACSH